MVEDDLRKLSAPLEALRDEVKSAYARVDSRWNAVLKQLNKLPIPCTVGFTYWSHPHVDCRRRVEYRKWKGSKRICETFYELELTPEGVDENETVTPYEEWSAEQRVQLLKHVPDLFKSAEKQVREFIEATKKLGGQ